MNNESTASGLGSLQNVSDKNVKLNRVVAEWWRAAQYLQENKSRFEPNELEAFEYILSTPARGVADEDTFGTYVNLLREIKYQYTDEFGEQAGNFAGKSGKILKNIQEFADALESHRMKASSGVSINQVKRAPAVGSLGGSATRAAGSSAATMRTIRGDNWEGTFDEAGNPYGSGTIYYASGAVYTGQWSPAGPHGNGTIIQPDGDKWEALFRDGKPVDGKIFYANGNRYEGGLNDSGRNGIGRTFTENYEEYGQYTDDSRQGNGKIVFKNGDFYEGGWNDEGPHGRGTLFDSVNKRTDTGDFINGRRYGNGRMVWGDTKVCYEGTWRDTPQGMEGEGMTYVLPNGRRTPVQYRNGQPVRVTPGMGKQPPYNPRVNNHGNTAKFQRPGSHAARNFIGICGGVIFGIFCAFNFLAPFDLEGVLICAAAVAVFQLVFAGKFDYNTGQSTRKVYYSPVALTAIFLIVVGGIDISVDGFTFEAFFAVIIGVITLIISTKK